MRIYALVDAQVFEDQGIYFQVTRGAARRDHAFPANAEPTVFMMSNALVNPQPAQVEKGASAVSAQDFRWLRCDIKSISLIGNCLRDNSPPRRAGQRPFLFRDGSLPRLRPRMSLSSNAG